MHGKKAVKLAVRAVVLCVFMLFCSACSTKNAGDTDEGKKEFTADKAYSTSVTAVAEQTGDTGAQQDTVTGKVEDTVRQAAEQLADAAATAEPAQEATPVPTATPILTAAPVPTAAPLPTPTPVPDKDAVMVEITIETGTGWGMYDMKDGKYASRTVFGDGDTIRVTAGEDMYGAYIIWGLPDIDYTLTYSTTEAPDNTVSVSGGENGILHDYVEFTGPAREFVITTHCYCAVCDIYCYTDGRLPENVQRWELPCEQADMLAFSTHADDEVLFFGGAIIDAAVRGYDVQVVYLCSYWEGDFGDPRREHEKLDGLWEMGVRHYPVNMPFTDMYSTSLEGAMSGYDLSKVETEMTTNIRRFKPLVIVTHDINGEYGHGGHMLVNLAVRDIIDRTGDADYCSDSALKYGAWDVPKTYFHLYGENKIRLDLREPLDALNGQTILEVAADAYGKHVTQHQYSFYVSDDYEYSCADFGLYRTTVGYDTGNDMMENVDRVY